MNGIWFFVSAVIISSQVPLVGARWQRIIEFIAGDSLKNISSEVQATNASAIFMGQIFPSPTADALRFYWLHKLGFSFVQAGMSVLIDRLLALYVYLLMSLIILYCMSLSGAISGFSALFLFSAIALLVFGVFFTYLSEDISKQIIKFLRFERLGHALSQMKRLLFGKTGLVSLVICFVVHFLTIISIYFLGFSLHMDLSIISAAMLMVCMVLATLAPISIGGWGFREFAAISLTKVMPGLSIEGATAISLLFGMVTLFGSLMPLAYWGEKLPMRSFFASKQRL